jgi:hypothetical protein
MLMRLINWKLGVYTTLFAGFVGIIGLPIGYDFLGDGAAKTRSLIINSAEVRKQCGNVRPLIIVPLKLSLELSEGKGDLSLAYWFVCGGKLRIVESELVLIDGTWIPQTIQIDLPNGKVDLVLR